MTEATATTAAVKTPWYRRTAPAQLGDLATGLWFMGQAQLYLAAVCLLVGAVGVVATIAISIAAGEYTPIEWTITAITALPFAAAFLFSGLALRVVATIVDARTTPLGRIVTIVSMMVLIAAGAVVIVAIGIGAIFIGSYGLTEPLD